ncbi:hypothetical protein G7046_g484 [Stylonectria norvegica]|nr:hypothetical protein G7046_g484 [Stylonectria norvegica]
MARSESDIPGEIGSGQSSTQLSRTTITGLYVTLERIVPAHIPLLFLGLGFPQNNHIVDWITGFPYIHTENDLSDHIFGSLRDHPDLTIFAIKACQSHLGPPNPSTTQSHDSVLGIIGYRHHPPSRTIKLDDILFSPVLQHTYASTEAHYLLLRHLFEEQTLSYSRVWLTSNALNVKSRRHTERMGYKYEGTFRKDNITRWGTSRDSDCLSIIDDEWPSNKRVLQSWLLPTNFDADGRQIASLQEVPEWSLICIAAGIIVARLHLRIRTQKRSMIASDYLLCAAWVSASAMSSIDIFFYRMGALKGDVLLTFQGYKGTPADFQAVSKAFWAISFPFYTTLYLCKAALLSQFLYIFPKTMRKRRALLWSVIVYAACAYLLTVISILCLCLPIQRHWSLDPVQRCPKRASEQFLYVSWTLHFFGDCAIFAIPWFIVPGLQIKWKLKIGMYCTFCLGLFSMAFALVRLVTIEVSIQKGPTTLVLFDLWRVLDCNIGLVVAGLPSLRPYFRRGREATGYSSHISSSTNENGKTQGGAAFELIGTSADVEAPEATASSPSKRMTNGSLSKQRDSFWESGSKSNGSHIDLANVQSV